MMVVGIECQDVLRSHSKEGPNGIHHHRNTDS